LIHRFNASHPILHAGPETTEGLEWISRCLLLLIGVSLFTMPITEHLWIWDCFLHDGQDFELGALLVLSFFCLMMVLSRQCQQRVESISLACSVDAFELNLAAPAKPVIGKASDSDSESGTDPGRNRSDFPLQI